MKPTRARNPLGPDRGEGWGGFSCGHVVSISVRDSAVMLDAIHGPEAVEPLCRAAAGTAVRAGSRPRSRPAAHRLHRQVALWRRDRSRDRRRGARRRHACWQARPSRRGARAGACRRSGRGDGDHRRRQHRADRAAWPSSAFGRAMTEHDFEILTLASAHNAQKPTATDYVAAQLDAFQISRGAREFFETCDVFLCPTLCTPPLRIGELNSMAEDLSHIAPILRRYMPGDRDVQHVRPAGDVGAAGMEHGRLAARHDVRGAASATRRRCFAWPASSSRRGPGRTDCRRFAHRLTKLSLIRERKGKSLGDRDRFACRRSIRRPEP